MAFQLEDVAAILRQIGFPGQDKDILELKMVENLVLDKEKISFALVLPKKNHPFKKLLEKTCIDTLSRQLNISKENITIEIKEQNPHAKAMNDILPGVKNIIAVASGKGGVGKSTVAVNLAVALAKQGLRVGLVDADVFGPSVPKMFNLMNAHPEGKKINGKDVIIPIEQYGVKLLSIGFFVDPDSALIWRGPMATNALQQLIGDADWGELDYLLIDLPPGTSDIHLTLVQTVAVTGAVIVSTPQQVALADAIKGISMFRTDKIDVPILGLVENMAWFTPVELPENKYYIFGKEGCRILAENYGIPLLGQIPIVQSICQDGDSGRPSALDKNSMVGAAFARLAENVIKQVDIRNKSFDPTKKVNIQ